MEIENLGRNIISFRGAEVGNLQKKKKICTAKTAVKIIVHRKKKEKKKYRASAFYNPSPVGKILARDFTKKSYTTTLKVRTKITTPYPPPAKNNGPSLARSHAADYALASQQ